MSERPPPVVTPLPNIEKDHQRALAEELQRKMPGIVENATLVAQYRKAYFDAYVAAGFTEAQALELCAK